MTRAERKDAAAKKRKVMMIQGWEIIRNHYNETDYWSGALEAVDTYYRKLVAESPQEKQLIKGAQLNLANMIKGNFDEHMRSIVHAAT